MFESLGSSLWRYFLRYLLANSLWQPIVDESLVQFLNPPKLFRLHYFHLFYKTFQLKTLHPNWSNERKVDHSLVKRQEGQAFPLFSVEYNVFLNQHFEETVNSCLFISLLVFFYFKLFLILDVELFYSLCCRCIFRATGKQFRAD
jgi:hypothetical protein